MSLIFPSSLPRRGDFRIDGNWRPIGLICLSICVSTAVFVWMRMQNAPDDHRRARQLMLYYTLSRIDDPVIVVGDSIVEASTLPRSICGHAIVNAGLNGASTASDLGSWLAEALDGKKASAIIVALGTNDALESAGQNRQLFVDRYSALLALYSKLTPRLAVLGIPPAEARGRVTVKMQQSFMETIHDYNSALPDMAAANRATFVPLPAMPEPHTIDGIHLDSDGYLAWEKAVMQAAAMSCG